jgi:hypothetical protein
LEEKIAQMAAGREDQVQQDQVQQDQVELFRTWVVGDFDQPSLSGFRGVLCAEVPQLRLRVLCLLSTELWK